MRPLLKWAGGKRTQVERIVSLFPEDYGDYHELFFGGGAVFFHITPGGGTINDINPRLINFYRVVRDSPRELIEEASRFIYDEAEYYERRERFNSPGLSDVEDAALFLYLNRTAYNGLYRVNSKGEFNVPFGTYKNPTIVPRKRVLATSEALGNVGIRCEDFGYILDVAEEGDLCYMDPPYNPASETANFTDYSVEGFGLESHERLRDLCVELDGRGVWFVLSNSDTPEIREIFDGKDFEVRSFRTRRMISSKVSSRSSGSDLLITNCR